MQGKYSRKKYRYCPGHQAPVGKWHGGAWGRVGSAAGRRLSPRPCGAAWSQQVPLPDSKGGSWAVGLWGAEQHPHTWLPQGGVPARTLCSPAELRPPGGHQAPAPAPCVAPRPAGASIAKFKIRSKRSPKKAIFRAEQNACAKGFISKKIKEEIAFMKPEYHAIESVVNTFKY